MTRLITGLEVHRYAPELNKLHLRNRQTLPAPGITTIKEAKARLFGRWQPGHQVTITVSHPDYVNLSRLYRGRLASLSDLPASDQTAPAPQRARHPHRHSNEVSLIMTTIHPTHSPELQTLTPLPSISWGLPRDISPRFGARLIQSRYRLDFLSDRASLIGEWSQMQIAKLDLAFPEIIKALEAKLLTGELDAQRQQRITVHHGGFTCEADTLGSHGYLYVAIYSTTSMGANPDRKA